MSEANFTISTDGAVWVETVAPGAGDFQVKFRWMTRDERKAFQDELTEHRKREAGIEAMRRAINIAESREELDEAREEHDELVQTSHGFVTDFADAQEERLVDIRNVKVGGEEVTFGSEMYNKLRDVSPEFNDAILDAFLKMINGEAARLKNSNAPAGIGRRRKSKSR